MQRHNGQQGITEFKALKSGVLLCIRKEVTKWSGFKTVQNISPYTKYVITGGQLLDQIHRDRQKKVSRKQISYAFMGIFWELQYIQSCFSIYSKGCSKHQIIRLILLNFVKCREQQFNKDCKPKYRN